MARLGASRNPWFWTVLTLLHERPMHPYEIAQLTRQRGKDLLAEHRTGSLYSAIERLRADGLIEPEAVTRDGRLPERTVYRITEAGRSALLDWLEGEIGGFDARDLPRFAFAAEKITHLGPSVAASLLEARAVAVETQITGLQHVLTDAGRRGVRRASLLEVEYALALRTAELAYLRALLDDLAVGRLTWPTPPTKEERS